MSTSLILDALTDVPVLLKEYEFPQLVASAGIVPAPDAGKYYLLGTGNSIVSYSNAAELFLLTDKGTKARVKPQPSSGDTGYGAAIEFTFDGDPETLKPVGGTSISCQVYTISRVALYNRESWKVENQLRFQQAVVASQKTEWMSQPLNVIFYVLNVAAEAIGQWREAKANQLNGDAAYSSDSSIITPEYIDDQIDKWQQAQGLMTPLSEFALAQGITNPLSPAEASIEQRVHRIKAILAALNMTHSDLLERMNGSQIDTIFADIMLQLGDKQLVSSAADDNTDADAGKSDTPGKPEKEKSPKSAKSSQKSLPAEATQSSFVEKSPSTN